MAGRGSSVEGRAPANAALRGGGLIVLAVVLGVALLAWGFTDEGGLVAQTDDTAVTDDPTTTEPTDTDVTEPPPGLDDDTDTTEPGEVLPEARPPEETVVYVRNASGVGGVAGRVRDHLLARNYLMRSPDNTPGRVEATTIFHLDGWRSEAMQIADELNVADAGIVVEMPDPPPEDTDMGEAHILIILGEDEAIGIAQG
jgi:hypothetical protein